MFERQTMETTRRVSQLVGRESTDAYHLIRLLSYTSTNAIPYEILSKIRPCHFATKLATPSRNVTN